MDTTPPIGYGVRLRHVHQASEADLRLTAKCSFSLGLPPGFVERLLARCCRLGFPYPFWRNGALIVGDGVGERRSFSLTFDYAEQDQILKLDVFG
ncbi:unnamed protein product, partial [Ectocarpus sp. 12 AP-2014]